MEQRVLKKAMPIEEIIDSIREYEAANIAPNVYFFFSYNHYVDLLANQSSSTARLETQSLGAIKKMFKGYWRYTTGYTTSKKARTIDYSSPFLIIQYFLLQKSGILTLTIRNHIKNGKI